jgi:hypothetical protein
LSADDQQKALDSMATVGLQMPADLAHEMLVKAAKPIFLVKYEKTGWELEQGEESCSVQVKQ